MTRFILTLLGGLFSLATLGAIMVGVGLGAIFFMYGKDLPDHETLKQYEPATISRVYSGEGYVMDEFARERRLFTPIEDIPDTIKQSFVSAEDKNFFDHKGYDLFGIAKAIFDAAMGDRLRGASTITQQVAKNIFLSGDRSAERKIREILLAARMETVLSKDDILEIYLNEIFLGQNSYGVTAAAETYFGKTLEELSIEEMAYIAALPKAPSDYHPVRQKTRAISRRNFVIKELAENKYISDAQAKEARDADLITVQSGDLKSARAKRPPRDYFTDEIRRQLSNDFGEEEFFAGGLSVRATMDPDLQVEAARALREGLEKYDRATSPWRGPVAQVSDIDLTSETEWRAALNGLTVPRDIEDWFPALVLEVGDSSVRIGIEGIDEDEDGHFLSFKTENSWAKNRLLEDGTRIRIKSPADMWSSGDVVMVKPKRDSDGNVQDWTLRQIPEVQGGFMAMDTNTGRVLALQGGFSYQHSVFNRATQANRQPGSAIKPFVYASALDSGYSPVSIVVDAPIEINTPQGLWVPKNASNKFYGPAPLRVGIEQSRNLMTIRLAQDVGMGVVAGYAERFGVYNRMQRVLAGSLGSQETTLYRMVAAYAMFANGGERVEPTMVDRVQDRFGKTIFQHDKRSCDGCDLRETREGRSPKIISDRERVMDPVTAYQLTSMMRGVVERGTARRAITLDAPIAGKTGTTNDARDVWFVGFTPNIVAGCYIGFDTPRSMGKGASGGGMCGPVFNRFMARAIKRYGAGKFETPENTMFLKFDRFSGARLPDDATGDHVVSELFRVGEEPQYGDILDTIDGGFVMGSDLEIFSKFGGKRQEEVVKTATGKVKKIGKAATVNSIRSGGQY
jgi:penicillin-binding protein 1A